MKQRALAERISQLRGAARQSVEASLFRHLAEAKVKLHCKDGAFSRATGVEGE